MKKEPPEEPEVKDSIEQAINMILDEDDEATPLPVPSWIHRGLTKVMVPKGFDYPSSRVPQGTGHEVSDNKISYTVDFNSDIEAMSQPGEGRDEEVELQNEIDAELKKEFAVQGHDVVRVNTYVFTGRNGKVVANVIVVVNKEKYDRSNRTSNRYGVG